MMRARLWLWVGLVAVLCGCGDDDGQPIALVVENQGEPVPDAAVAIDTGSGRVEGVTDSTGRVELSVVDVSDVRTAIVHRPGWRFAILSASRIARSLAEDGDLRFEIRPVAIRDRVTIGGTATLTDNSHWLVVSTTDRTFHEGGGPIWDVEIERDTSQRIYALEYYVDQAAVLSPRGRAFPTTRVLGVEHEGSPDDDELALDMVSAQEPLIGSGTFDAPSDPLMRNNGRGHINVVTLHPHSRPVLGTGSITDVVAGDDKQWFFTASYGTPFEDEPIYTFLRFFGEGEVSGTIVPGPPEGALDASFHTPPRIVSPERPELPHPIGEPIVWELHDGPPFESLVMTFFNDNDAVGIWFGTEDDTRMTMPELPSGSDPRDVFPHDLRGEVHTCDTTSETFNWCVRFAQAPSFTIAP